MMGPCIAHTVCIFWIAKAILMIIFIDFMMVIKRKCVAFAMIFETLLIPRISGYRLLNNKNEWICLNLWICTGAIGEFLFVIIRSTRARRSGKKTLKVRVLVSAS